VAAPDPYDKHPYTDHAYAESHPDRLSVVARMSGWQPPELENARILELGCGRGGNLLPMAASLPGATLVGVDRSALQIDEAAQIARAARLDNVRLIASPIEELHPDGAYDFVVCHGVCSWVPPATRAALLEKIAAVLAPGGIAYVSFNVLPGWYERLAARDWLRLFPGPEPASSLAWLRDAISPEQPDYRRRIDAVVKRLAETEPAYALHEYLAEEHHPQRVSDLLAEATAAGLAYLGDAIPSETALELLAGPVAARAADLDVTARQQLVDMVRCTAFRRTLLVRGLDALARDFRPPPHLDPRALDALRVTSRLRPHGAADESASTERFDGPGGVALLQTGRGIRRGLHALARAAPHSLAFRELATTSASSADELRAELFDLWLASGAVDLHVREPRLRGTLGADRHPLACALARWHAAHGGAITNAWHQEVRLDDPLLRVVLARLDGTRSTGDLARELGESGHTASLDAGARLELAQAAVEALASAALLVA
jgi:SAM-dependent methyltransferase